MTFLFELPTEEDWNTEDEIDYTEPPDWYIEEPEWLDIDALRASHSRASDWREYVQMFIPFLDPDQEYIKKINENKQRKISRCGQKCIIINKKGIPVLTPFNCGICDECRKAEAKSIRQAIIQLNKPLNLIKCNIDDKDKETRRLRDKGIKYQVYFHEAEVHILIDNQELGMKFNPQAFDFLKWTETHETKRRSGNLIQSNRSLIRNEIDKDRDDILDSGSILVRKILPKFDKLPDGYNSIEDLMQTIRRNVIAQSADFAPKDIEQLQNCFRQRETLVIEQIRQFGGVVLGIEFYNTSMRYVTVDTPQEWLDAAERVLDGSKRQLRLI